jgi:hypothetical protein
MIPISITLRFKVILMQIPEPTTETVLIPDEFKDQVSECLNPEEASGCQVNVIWSSGCWYASDLSSSRALSCAQKFSGIPINFIKVNTAS